jgi:putative PIN family toxin of toxin-antitoxin system
MRLILDINVVISGLLWRGPPARLIDLVVEQAATACMNPFLVEELVEKLKMPKFASRIATAGLTADELTGQFIALCEHVPALSIARTCRDVDDDNVLAAATAASADLIVSGDRDLLILQSFNGTPILNATDALARMAEWR